VFHHEDVPGKEVLAFAPNSRKKSVGEVVAGKDFLGKRDGDETNFGWSRRLLSPL
jgi:hypothetical protein